MALEPSGFRPRMGTVSGPFFMFDLPPFPRQLGSGSRPAFFTCHYHPREASHGKDHVTKLFWGKKQKGPFKRPFLLAPVRCSRYFFFFFTFGASAAGAGADFQLLRSCAILWQSPHLGNLAIILSGCFSPWQSWHFGTILCFS